MMNKPKDVIATMRTDESGRNTLTKFLPKLHHERLVPIGGMHRIGSGLILLTNEIDWIHKLTHPSYGIRRRFDVIVKGNITSSKLHLFRNHNSKTSPLQKFNIMVSEINKKDNQMTLDVELDTSPKKTIDGMIQELGGELISCKCTEVGPIRLQSLKRGKWRLLTTNEVNQLKASCGK